MLVAIQVINFLAFTFVAWVLTDALIDSLKDSCLVKPIAISLCGTTISYHLLQTSGGIYVVAVFAGFFLHTCMNAYVKKKRKSSPSKKKPSVKINP